MSRALDDGPEIRRARSSDDDAVEALLIRAYGDEAAARLRRSLNGDGDLLVDLAAFARGELVGAISLARAEIRGEGSISTAALAVVAVAPDARGEGIGAAMFRVALAEARRKGAEAALARGGRRFLERVGFDRATAENVATPQAWPDVYGVSWIDGVDRLQGDAYLPRAFFGEGGG